MKMSILYLKNSVEQAVRDKNWYAALVLAMTLPDICGRLENPKLNSERRYINWFDKYLLKHYKNEFFGKDFAFLVGTDCYALRCTLLHEGNENITKQRAREILDSFAFATTGSHRVKIESVLMLDVSEFCKEMCNGVEAWYADVKNNSEIIERINEMLKIRETGFSPVPGIFVK